MTWEKLVVSSVILALVGGCSSSDVVPPANGGTKPEDGGSDAEGGGPGIQSGTLIRIDTGQVQGDTDGATRRFRGIPFIAPPVGPLRFKPPQPVPRWDGVRMATAYSPKCPQVSGLLGPASAEEDCIYLNVWTPDPAPTKPLPVMVWLHGGANTTGSASDEVPLGVGGHIFDGRALAESENVVVVTTNYRLGALGFFAHPALTAEDPRGVSGNQGLLDQRAAFEWVRRNILAFGGDPGNVTIFGESAGSVDVCFHMMSPGSRSLFHKAISQSGGCTMFVPPRSGAEAQAVTFAAQMGCGTAPDVLDCLRSTPVSQLIAPAPVEGGNPDLPGGAPYQGGTPAWDFRVIVDGDFLPQQPRALVAAGDFAKVPYLVGSNTDEGTIFHIGEPPVTTEAEYQAALERRFGQGAAEIRARYPVSDFSSPQEALMRVTGDASLVCGTYDSARRVAVAGVPVYLYNFDRPIPIPALAGFNLRATHGAEIAYVFGSVTKDMPPEDLALGKTMRGYWTRLAATGDPNGEGALSWPAWKSDADVRMNFDTDPDLVTDFRRALCEFWGTRYDADFR